LRSNKTHTQVFIDTILYIKAYGNYSKVVTINETITIRKKFSDLLATLSNDDFLQVHKSYAIAKRHIKNIEGNKIFIEKHVVPIAKTYKAKIIQLLK